MMPIERLCSFIAVTRFAFANEVDLQAGLSELLDGIGVAHVREHPLSPHGRVDFYLPGQRAGIETKIKGSPSAVLGQLAGYAKHDDVDALILVTSRLTLNRVPATLNGKPLYSVPLWANGL